MTKNNKIIDKELVCSKCNISFKCTRKRYYKHNRLIKLNGKHSPLCETCRKERLKQSKNIKCLNCETETSNSKFCSRSCAQSYNNKLKPKRKPIERSCSCGKTFIPKFKSSRILCESCQEDRMNSVKYKAMTLADYHIKSSIKDKHPSWRNCHIRTFNRSWNKELTKQPCSNCGYDKHVELAHIKAVSSFPETATLEEVNSPDNNLVLCRNCHWEYDNGLLKVWPDPLVH